MQLKRRIGIQDLCAIAHLFALGAEKGFQRFGGTHGLRLGVVESPQIAQRLEELR
ncbi:hypothetical protein D3C86_1983470 [compost metagenome]